MARFLVVLDVDSTLIEQEVIELLAEEAGVLEEVAEITFRAMNGELDFEQSLRSRVATLAGLDTEAIARVRERVTVTRGVPELVAGVQAAGGAVAVVSGGFHEVVGPIAARLGLDEWRANRLEVAEGRLTGAVIPPVVDAAAKAHALEEWATARCIPLAQTVAIGDGANDLPMLGEAGLGIAFRAKPLVKQNAEQAISTLGLDGILYLIGVRDKDQAELLKSN